MTLSIWRVINNRYAHLGLSGEGARLYGGRWTSPGYPVIYCAQHLSLAILEILVHTERKQVLASYSKISLTISEAQVYRVSAAELPEKWAAPFPGFDLQEIGDLWLRSQRSLVLQLPSVIVNEENNYLVNPHHPDFNALHAGAVEPVALDVRLFNGE